VQGMVVRGGVVLIGGCGRRAPDRQGRVCPRATTRRSGDFRRAGSWCSCRSAHHGNLRCDSIPNRRRVARGCGGAASGGDGFANCLAADRLDGRPSAAPSQRCRDPCRRRVRGRGAGLVIDIHVVVAGSGRSSTGRCRSRSLQTLIVVVEREAKVTDAAVGELARAA